MDWNKDAEAIMKQRFGKDTVLSLATIYEGIPYVRYVNAYYETGSFYVITHALSNKMKHIECNARVALASDWFQAHGDAISLGYFNKEENREIAATLRQVFASWIDNGHNDFQDEHTIILRIDVCDAVLFSHGTRYDMGTSIFHNEI